jgi:hypothetical protein
VASRRTSTRCPALVARPSLARAATEQREPSKEIIESRILSILGGPSHPWFGSFDAAGAVPLAAVMAACFVLATGSYLLGRNGSGP